MRSALAKAAALVAVFACAGSARAEPPSKQTCADAATRGQVYRDDGKLRSAAEAFSLCADPACSPVVQRACVEWLADAKKRLPTLIVRINKDPAAHDIELRIDDAPSTPDQPTPVDAGQHTVRVEARGRRPVVMTVALKEHESRTVEVDVPAEIASKSEPRAPASERPIPLPVWILGGVSLLAIGSFAYFGSSAKSETDRMLGECAPACPVADRDAAFRLALVADISLGVSVLAAGSAAYFFFTRPTIVPSVTTGASGSRFTVGGRF